MVTDVHVAGFTISIQLYIFNQSRKNKKCHHCINTRSVRRKLWFMLSFFDNIYYQLYLRTPSEDEAKNRDWASSILTLLQALNALTIYISIAYALQTKEISKAIVVLITIFIIIFNYIRYQYSEKRNPSTLSEKWSEISIQEKNIKKVALAIYVIATVTLCIASMIIFYRSIH